MILPLFGNSQQVAVESLNGRLEPITLTYGKPI